MFILENNDIIIKEHVVKITPYFEALNTGNTIEKDISDPFKDIEPIYKSFDIIDYKCGCTIHMSDGSKHNMYAIEIYESENGGINLRDMEKIKHDSESYAKNIAKIMFEDKSLKKIGIRKK